MTKRIFIDTRATEYSCDDVRSTASVSELIKQLKRFDGDTLVYFRNYGYRSTSYGPVNPEDFTDCE